MGYHTKGICGRSKAHRKQVFQLKRSSYAAEHLVTGGHARNSCEFRKQLMFLAGAHEKCINSGTEQQITGRWGKRDVSLLNSSLTLLSSAAVGNWLLCSTSLCSGIGSGSCSVALQMHHWESKNSCPRGKQILLVFTFDCHLYETLQFLVFFFFF